MTTQVPPSAGVMPQLQVTRYEITAAALTAAMWMALLSTMSLAAVWFSNRQTDGKPHPPGTDRLVYSLTLSASHDEWSAPAVAPAIGSPETTNDDPSVVVEQAAVTDMTELAAAVAVAADELTTLPEDASLPDTQPGFQTVPAGRTGISHGTRSGTGTDDGKSGSSLRWYVTFDAGGDLQTYVQLLQALDIELGALDRNAHELVYLLPSLDPMPATRVVQDGRDEKRLFMNWQGGSLVAADRELFARAGLDATGHTIMHFYSAEAEQRFARLEREFSGKQPEAIRKTHFRVRKLGGEVQVEVVKQLLR